ncbi:MAG: ATP-binding protein [Steroidobacteraceae bacterium]
MELRPEMTELAAVVDAAVETARPVIDGKRHRFSVTMPSEPVVFAADPLRLAQILSNLLTNAAKYTDPTGHIRLAASADAEQVTILILDTGIGMSDDALTRVFVMFSQVQSSQDRSEGGLGIGLALAKGLVELHGGVIEARSGGLGKGSEFTVQLPRRSIVTSERPLARIESAERACRRRVLIADDNCDAAESLAVLLRLDGHEVTVLDIGMPELDGYEVARQVRQRSMGRAVTLIAVTGWGQQADRTRALAAGFNHHFTEPIDPELISQLLQRDPRME